jgi:hypothetical protein
MLFSPGHLHSTLYSIIAAEIVTSEVGKMEWSGKKERRLAIDLIYSL